MEKQSRRLNSTWISAMNSTSTVLVFAMNFCYELLTISFNVCIYMIKKLTLAKDCSSFHSFSLLVDGNWGQWTNTTCTKTCGSGTLLRSRSCSNPFPSNGGLSCVLSNGSGRGSNEIVTSNCNSRPCESKWIFKWILQPR